MAVSRAGASPAQRTLDAAINQNMLGMAVSGAVLRLQPWMRISPPILAASILRICAAGNIDDILVKIQANKLKQVLPDGACVGTVDKLLGQEAPVVIISMATSNGNELPRNLEFPFSKSPLNVAISRAKCLALVVANPKLPKVKCANVEQMALSTQIRLDLAFTTTCASCRCGDTDGRSFAQVAGHRCRRESTQTMNLRQTEDELEELYLLREVGVEQTSWIR